ncbi:hypothetical protein EJB05_52791, partial [Eragrostis curvula]
MAAVPPDAWPHASSPRAPSSSRASRSAAALELVRPSRMAPTPEEVPVQVEPSTATKKRAREEDEEDGDGREERLRARVTAFTSIRGTTKAAATTAAGTAAGMASKEDSDATAYVSGTSPPRPWVRQQVGYLLARVIEQGDQDARSSTCMSTVATAAMPSPIWSSSIENESPVPRTRSPFPCHRTSPSARTCESRRVLTAIDLNAEPEEINTELEELNAGMEEANTELEESNQGIADPPPTQERILVFTQSILWDLDCISSIATVGFRLSLSNRASAEEVVDQAAQVVEEVSEQAAQGVAGIGKVTLSSFVSDLQLRRRSMSSRGRGLLICCWLTAGVGSEYTERRNSLNPAMVRPFRALAGSMPSIRWLSSPTRAAGKHRTASSASKLTTG